MIFWTNIVLIACIIIKSGAADSNCACGRAALAKLDSFDQEMVAIQNHPWVVRLVATRGTRDTKRRGKHCDGYVISPRHILTRNECGCRQNFTHTLYHGSSLFLYENPTATPGIQKIDLADIKCLDTKEFTVIELPEALPLSSKLKPICVAESSVYDKTLFRTYQVSWNFFSNRNFDSIDAICQWKIDPKKVEFEPEKHRTRLPLMEEQIGTRQALLALSPSGQWSITGIDLTDPEWNYKNDMALHLDVYRDVLKKSPEICFV
ncbi:uncharacterized protein LOC141856391 [Brevipalpus obovatus]|uniref:uncharacterized protein LOC141856391 n=1 Tax=Brevipalpus obovatus TaxID=246614 RepID=UPI003D9E9490